jgi:hypothetical protein
MVNNKVNNFLYEKESYEIRGACFDVYKNFGGAFKERIIDKSLTIALEKRGLRVEEQANHGKACYHDLRDSKARSEARPVARRWRRAVFAGTTARDENMGSRI